MGMILNIDEAVKLRAEYNLLLEPINPMMSRQIEDFEKSNPIDDLFVRETMDGLQKTYVDKTGMNQVISETSDFAIGNLSNTGEGFSKTFANRTFQGRFMITQQVIEDADRGAIKDTATAYITARGRNIVTYCMAALDSGFATGETKDSAGTQNVVYWGNQNNGGVSRLALQSADTVDGDPYNATKRPLFSKFHTTVAKKNRPAINQSNKFIAQVALDGTDPEAATKAASVLLQVGSYMKNLKDDNGERAGVDGLKTIVCAENYALLAVLNAANTNDTLGGTVNQAKGAFTIKAHSYLNDIKACAPYNGSTMVTDGTLGSDAGFFMVDKAYMARAHGLTFSERIPFTMTVVDLGKSSEGADGVLYKSRERFDTNVATWRGISYVRFVKSTTALPAELGAVGTYTVMTPVSAINAKPIIDKTV